MANRVCTINRKTNETNIDMKLNIDGSGQSTLKTGIGFFDHMLTHIAKHGFFDLEVTCDGDLEVDCHHSIEDIGIVLGKCIREAVGDKIGIKRYGSCILPMDETLVLCALDLSGRPYLNFDVALTALRLGDMDVEMVKEFFMAVAVHAGMNLHIKLLDGSNNHHIVEGIFKAFGNALDQATLFDERIIGTRSTKGMLE
ncbi:imidazoleglycerol-phosphate dehydratase [Mn(II)-dependent] [Petrocella atlantisensis]|uniref:Imidazoleglycerol-phosphate dehydratase n=1 Tax=Petrocella atlantisensis TaxID=2173034 RepID=A0A3P7RYT8_9FIRM|nr:imidazoleglycerol-phosphate dehydratase HisB [Petrocella atlantisensis]MCF8020338.1 imidazoleglycerol-phosphate dehydratase HisB [Vallitaleaceae bacterium]PKM53969.1 MAG: imidazoleglycerol-phosphate dehydratase HisB [Firmicutes bacterium HGW-Firmicutes-5]VDN45939.1 imidazoleglycerol-phosphate dehydratase [Mn(II)-dependent] [Petrocella atlantisensis]